MDFEYLFEKVIMKDMQLANYFVCSINKKCWVIPDFTKVCGFVAVKAAKDPEICNKQYCLLQYFFPELQQNNSQILKIVREERTRVIPYVIS